MNFYLERLQKDIATVVEGLTPEDLAWHPTGKWSTGEILEHLYLTYTGTTKGFERCISNGAPLARVPTVSDRMRTFVVVRCKFLPSGRTAPKQAMPRGLPLDQVQREMFAKLTEMDAAIARAEEKYGATTRLLDHPILGPLTASEWCVFHWVHGRHHKKQMVALRDAARASTLRSNS